MDLCASLRRFTSPTIANAIESFQVRPRTEGYTDSQIVCLFPDLGPLVGYACTAVIRSAEPPAHPRVVHRRHFGSMSTLRPGRNSASCRTSASLPPAPIGAS